MQKIIALLVLVGIFALTTNNAYSQEASLATFQETATVLVDKSRSQNVTASITLQTTSTQEIRISPQLENMIRENDRITSVIITNQQQCILGVVDESCIMINVKRDPSDKGIIEIQDSTKALGFWRLQVQFLEEGQFQPCTLCPWKTLAQCMRKFQQF